MTFFVKKLLITAFSNELYLDASVQLASQLERKLSIRTSASWNRLGLFFKASLSGTALLCAFYKINPKSEYYQVVFFVTASARYRVRFL